MEEKTNSCRRQKLYDNGVKLITEVKLKVPLC